MAGVLGDTVTRIDGGIPEVQLDSAVDGDDVRAVVSGLEPYGRQVTVGEDGHLDDTLVVRPVLDTVADDLLDTALTFAESGEDEIELVSREHALLVLAVVLDLLLNFG